MATRNPSGLNTYISNPPSYLSGGELDPAIGNSNGLTLLDGMFLYCETDK